MTFPSAECYSEASDHEEAESTEIPPPPYTDRTLQGPPGGTHQVGRAGTPSDPACQNGTFEGVLPFSGHASSSLLPRRPGRHQWVAVFPRQHDDVAQLFLLAGQAAAVLVGSGVAGVSRRRGDGRGVLGAGALAPARSRGGGRRGVGELLSAGLAGHRVQ